MIIGKSPTLLKVTYVRPDKKNDVEECFQVIYADDDGNVHYTEEPADADIYIVKPEYRNYDYNKPQERMERMDKIRVRISKIRDKIAQLSGDWGKRIVRYAEEQRNFKALNQLYKWPFCFACDFQPEYYYMKNWYEKYELKTPKLTKSFMDIEVDMMDYTVDMDNVKDTAFAPVNLITVNLESRHESYTFILRPYVPPRMGRSDEEYAERYRLYEQQLQAHEYLMSHLDEFIDELHQRFDETYGYISYHVREYGREIDLIADAMNYINSRKPNFCEIWNMRFDIQYLLARTIELEYDPNSIFCSRDIPNKVARFHMDQSTYQIEKQYDFFYVSSYTQYICQMRMYASVRKSQHKLRSVALNKIADRELKDRKVEYPEASNIKTFPYVDWRLFIIYNIKDTLLQVGIERKTNDLTAFYMRSHSNLTPYNKIFKETHLLRNVREMYFEKDGWVQGNNLNIIDDPRGEMDRRFYGDEDDDDDEKATFKGAINAEPLMNDNVGQYILGYRSNNLYINVMDYDMTAFYPSNKIASNMDPGTLQYKASFINDEFISGEYVNNSLNQQYEEKDKYGNVRKLDVTGEAVNTYVSGSILTFAFNWLGLPSIPQLRIMILDYVKNKRSK